jgi:hypothetical protein
MNFSQLLTDVRRIVEDQGFKWNDRVIAQYAVKGVNYFYRRLGETTQEGSINLVSGQNTYSLSSISGRGRVTEARIVPSSGTPYILKMVPLLDLGLDGDTLDSDPAYAALTQNSSEQNIVLYPAPNFNQSGGLVIRYIQEWVFTSPDTYSPPANPDDDDVPVLPRFETDLVHYVSGSLLAESNDQSFVEKGQYYLNKVEETLKAEDEQMKSKVVKTTGPKNNGDVLTFGEVVSDVRRVLDNHMNTETDTVSSDEYGRRWDDRVIAQHLVDGVNMIYRADSSVSDVETVAMTSGVSTVTLSNVFGRVTEVRATTAEGGQITLQELQITEIPTVAVVNGDPRYYALTKTGATDLEAETKLVVYPTPDRTDASGFQVTYSKEWEFKAQPTANPTQLETLVPVERRYYTCVSQYIVGNLLIEMNDEVMIQKGQYFLKKVKEDLAEMEEPHKVRRTAGKRVTTYMTLGELITDVRRLVENQAEIDGDSVAVLKNYGRRWDDRVIAQYARKGVNHIYRRAGSVSDQISLNLVQSQEIYTLSTPGRVIKVEIIPENSGPAVVLQQIQLAEIPTVQTDEKDPEYFALTQTVSGNDLQNTQDLVVTPAPARTTAGAIVVTYAMEWEFDADPTATAAQLDTEIPILPKFELDLTHYVAGSLLLELGSPTMAQKGQYLISKAEEEIGNLAAINSLSYWNNQPTRNFP